jgi:hypothetical protein
MRTEAATIVYAAFAFGVFVFPVGVAVGMLTGQYLRKSRRKVRCVISNWGIMWIRPQEWAIFSLVVDLFNEELSSIGLSSICAEFLLEGEKRAVSCLRKPASGQGELSALDLVLQQWTHARLYASFKGEEALLLTGLRRGGSWRVDFVGYFSNGEELRQKIVERNNYFSSHSKELRVQKNFAHS